MSKIEELLKDWRIWIYIIVLILSFLWVHPNFVTNGVIVTSINNPIFNEYQEKSLHTNDIIVNVNNVQINNITDYYNIINTFSENDTVRLKVKREVFPYYYKTIDIIPFLANVQNNTVKLGINVKNIPSTNLKFGLEIMGGTNLLLKPIEKIDDNQFDNILSILRERLNFYGLGETPITGITDLSGNKYIKIEFAGMTEEEAQALLEKQGNFVAKIGNITIFTGEDIRSVCVSPTECVNRLAPYSTGNGFIWQFAFQIDISQEAAERFANITSKLGRGECEASGCYLNETIDFYLDNELVSSLRISENLKGDTIRNPTITGSRNSKEEALKEKKRLQAILQSRELPVKLEIVELNTISPSLGESFFENIITLFVVSILFVDLVILIRYRNVKIAIPIIIITFSEIFITLGVASAINWTLDLSSIAGIIASVGTGVDDQIVITDGVLEGAKKAEEAIEGYKRKLKKAFFIIFAAFWVTLFSMIPLAVSGIPLLKGFAITTIIGIIIGVLITRPAYARILEITLKKKE